MKAKAKKTLKGDDVAQHFEGAMSGADLVKFREHVAKQKAKRKVPSVLKKVLS